MELAAGVHLQLLDRAVGLVGRFAVGIVAQQDLSGLAGEVERGPLSR